MSQFLSVETIRQHVTELHRQYERRRGKPLTFPLDANDVAERVFGLQVMYDTQGILNRIDDDILGCIYPDGHPSPWGKDKIIAVNLTPRRGFDPTTRNDNHTIAHECAGHYVLHFLKGIMGEQYRGQRSCTSKRDPIEWQADFAAGELLMPLERIAWLVDGKKPPDIINLEVYGSRFKDYFGANHMQMETRLSAVGYKLLNGRYDWANHAAKKPKPQVRSPRRQNVPTVDSKSMFDSKLFTDSAIFRDLFDWPALANMFGPSGASPKTFSGHRRKR
jgi:hypothetical protein